MTRSTLSLAVLAALAAAFAIAPRAQARDGEIRYLAHLSDSAGLSGRADFRDRAGVRKFSVELEGFTPGDRFDVMVAGVVVGTLEVAADGIGEIEYDDAFEPGQDDPATQFPASFPAVAPGTEVEVGPLLGTMQDRSSVRDRAGRRDDGAGDDGGGGGGGVLERYEATLAADAGAGDVSGNADFRVENGSRRFSVEVEGFTPGDVFDVMVAGGVVGTVTIDAFGIGQLDYDDRLEPGDTELPFPANFPDIDGGELVRVGVVSGTLQLR